MWTTVYGFPKTGSRHLLVSDCSSATTTSTLATLYWKMNQLLTSLVSRLTFLNESSGTIARAKPKTYLSICLLVRKLRAGARTIKKCAFPSIQVQADLRYLWNLAVSFRCKILLCFQKFWNK